MAPNKRKANTISNSNSKRVKATPKKTQKSLATSMTAVKPSDLPCDKWFEQYADLTTNTMPPDGVQRFFKDVGVSLDGVDTFLVAWKLQLERMGYITKDEWTMNMGRLNVASPDRFMQYLNSWKAELASDERALPQLYQYTFGYAKTVGQKSMQVDVALVLWDLLLGQQYPHIPKFIEFINETHPVKVINKDQWSSLLDFIKSIPFNLEGYDSTSSWPVLFDDYAQWRKQQQQQQH